MNKEYSPAWDEPVQMMGQQDSARSPQVSRSNAQAPQKQIVTIRLDVDTLEWFKSAGPGYQTRINQLLREHMDAERARAETADGAAA